MPGEGQGLLALAQSAAMPGGMASICNDGSAPLQLQRRPDPKPDRLLVCDKPHAAVRACGIRTRIRIRPAEGGYFRSASRISRSSTTSSGVGAGGAGGAAGASRFMRFICLTIMKMMKARMMKLIATVMKLP